MFYWIFGLLKCGFHPLEIRWTGFRFGHTWQVVSCGTQTVAQPNKDTEAWRGVVADTVTYTKNLCLHRHTPHTHWHTRAAKTTSITAGAPRAHCHDATSDCADTRALKEQGSRHISKSLSRNNFPRQARNSLLNFVLFADRAERRSIWLVKKTCKVKVRDSAF